MKILEKIVVLVLFVSLASFSFTENKRINIVFLGDSITEGGALQNPSTESTPVLVEKILKTNKQFSLVSIANIGFGGHTTVDFLPQTNTDFPKAIKAATIFAKDKNAVLVFSILLGTNDSAIFGPNGAPVSADNYKRNLKTIINGLIKEFPDAKFVLQYPLWYSPNTHNNAGYLKEGLQRLESYSPQLDALVEEYELSNPNQVFAGDKSGFRIFRKKSKKLFKPEEGKKGVFYLHPNAEGSEKLAKIWTKGILKAVE